MAKKETTDKNEIFCADEWAINATTTFKVALREFKGSQYVDLRRWFPDLKGHLRPGKGASIRPVDIRRVRKALMLIQRKLNAMRNNSDDRR